MNNAQFTLLTYLQIQWMEQRERNYPIQFIALTYKSLTLGKTPLDVNLAYATLTQKEERQVLQQFLKEVE